MAFATNNDLINYAPEVFDQGVDDWTAELGRAETDVQNQVQVKWFNLYKSRKDWDATKLTESQWTVATVYRALYAQILPKLSTFRPEGDPFREQIEFWKERFAEEMDTQFALGIKYDSDGDGTTTDAEIEVNYQNRLYR